MCGFVGLFDIRRKSDALRGQVLKMSKQIRHRGPDWSGVYCGERAILSHERLSIVDPQSGGQPLFSCGGKQVLAVNGEIYNHQEIRAELAGEYDFRTGSDCEVILPLYRKLGVGLLEKISGIFAFALYDIEKDEYLSSRSTSAGTATSNFTSHRNRKPSKGCAAPSGRSCPGTTGRAARGKWCAGTSATGSSTTP